MNGTSFTNIPEELQINILSQLERKPLSRCKCVSKHWNDTLILQAFMLKHFRSYDKHSKLVFVEHKPSNENTSVFSFELSNNNTLDRPTMIVPKTTKLSVRNNRTAEISTEEVIIGQHDCFTDDLLRKHKMSNICNDLVCLFEYHSIHIGLLNLKTRDFIYLPGLSSKKVGAYSCWPALGFDSVNKVFKVLSIYGGESKGCKAAIFTLGSKDWKPLEYKLPRYAATTIHWKNNNNRFYLDGMIYWVNKNNDPIQGTSMLTVVCFDLNLEVFRDYKLDTMFINDAKRIKYYYLTTLKGCPTLFVRKKESNEIQQFTFFNRKNPKAGYWNTRSFTASDFPKDFPYGCRRTCAAGGSILLSSVKPIKSSVETQEQDNSMLSWYKWYDLEKFAVD